MRLGIHVRIDPQRHARALAQPVGHGVQPVQFGDRFDVEAAYVVRQRQRHVGLALGHAREHHLARVAAGGQHAQQFAAGHDVETGAQLGKDLQHGKVRIGLHGELHMRVAALAGGGVGLVGRGQCGARVDVGRRAELGRDTGQRHLFDSQGAVAAGKEISHVQRAEGRGARVTSSNSWSWPVRREPARWWRVRPSAVPAPRRLPGPDPDRARWAGSGRAVPGAWSTGRERRIRPGSSRVWRQTPIQSHHDAASGSPSLSECLGWLGVTFWMAGETARNPQESAANPDNFPFFRQPDRAPGRLSGRAAGGLGV
ncbi:hypothetical protein D3C87_1195960 [compost metagenome]